MKVYRDQWSIVSQYRRNEAKGNVRRVNPISSIPAQSNPIEWFLYGYFPDSGSTETNIKYFCPLFPCSAAIAAAAALEKVLEIRFGACVLRSLFTQSQDESEG